MKGIGAHSLRARDAFYAHFTSQAQSFDEYAYWTYERGASSQGNEREAAWLHEEGDEFEEFGNFFLGNANASSYERKSFVDRLFELMR